MGIVSRVVRNFSLLRNVWARRVALRGVLDSDNFAFVRDFPPGHFYSPLPDLAEVLQNAAAVFDSSHRELKGVNLNENEQKRLLLILAKFYPDLPFKADRIPQHRYFLDNPFFSFGDGIILYSLMRCFKPARVIEVGSGFSSAEMLDVNDRFFENGIDFTFIEPYPERLYGLLSAEDRKRCKVKVLPVQQVDPSVFSALEENDILFVDSSHVGKIRSDVLHLLFEILPQLKRGVIVHFHDVLWPFEYPRNWLEGGRAWNEAYFLRAFLQYNCSFEILYFNSFMAIHQSKALQMMMPLVLKTPSANDTVGNSSLWLRKAI